MFALNRLHLTHKFIANQWPNNRCIGRYLSCISNRITGSVNNDCEDDDLCYDRFKTLATNKRTEALIKIILNEFRLYSNSDTHKHSIPDGLSVNHMKHLMDCYHISRYGRIWRDLSSAKRRHLLGLMKKLDDIDGHNHLIIPFMPYELEKFYMNGLKNSTLYGQNVCFDISFDRHMSTNECKNLAEQLHRIYEFNKYKTYDYSNELPFCLNLCNVNTDDKTIGFMNFLYPQLVSSKSYVNITSKSYLDLFDKRDLIFLSPHATQVMTEYDRNAVFIIGGIVDRNQVIELSLPKATKDGIRSMRLPIDSLVNKTNIQSLDSVFRLLCDFKAFGLQLANNEMSYLEKRVRKHIPNHKLKSCNQIAFETLKQQKINQIYDLDINDNDFDLNVDIVH
ncbi:tRNA methyltransferase 10 homolog B-like [Oppia nitens]|uniref:tRNA methyltransferase 10 homolog B-like n=1 Tax=Oppia nitens TaxID=1686743 RepID=UPI0023DCE89D|nr:tRNA methyltransferase 10 homolog B-like [Oppia nitens]